MTSDEIREAVNGTIRKRDYLTKKISSIADRKIAFFQDICPHSGRIGRPSILKGVYGDYGCVYCQKEFTYEEFKRIMDDFTEGRTGHEQPVLSQHRLPGSLG